MVAFVRVNLVGMLVYLFSNYIALSYIHENKEGWFHYTIVVVYTVLNQFLLFYSPLNSRINAVTFTKTKVVTGLCFLIFMSISKSEI